MSKAFSASRVTVLFAGLWLSLTFGLLAMSCAPAEEAQSWDSSAGLAALRAARIDDAAAHYQAAVQAEPGSAELAMGHGLTRLLTLVDAAASQDALADFGLSSVSLLPALYGPEGVWARRAAGASAGAALEPLFVAAELNPERRDSISGFLAGAPGGLSGVRVQRRVVELADELEAAASWFELAAQDEALCFVLPGPALHLSQDVAFGPPEAWALAGTLRVGAGFLLGLAGHAAGLVEPLGLRDLDAPALAARLNALRAAAMLDPSTLGRARTSLDLGLSDLSEALQQAAAGELGGCSDEEPAPARAAWGSLSPQELAGAAGIVDALRLALYGSSLLPDSAPRTVLDLSSYFGAPFWPAALALDPLRSEPAIVADAAPSGGDLVVDPGFVDAVLAPLAQPAPAGAAWPECRLSGGRSLQAAFEVWAAPLQAL